MSLAVQIRQHGGPEELQIVDVPVGEPGRGEIRIRHHAVGLNFIDVYHRTGLYPLNVPASIGMEAAGVVEAVGEGVTHLAPGDRAAYASNPPGARWVTPSPTASTTPAASMPMEAGIFSGYKPVRWYTSMKFRPMAWWRMRISPGPGSPTGTSTIWSSSGPPCWRIWTARLMATALL